MMIAGIASMKQPITRKQNAVMKPTLVIPPPHWDTMSTNSCGMWKYASSQPKADAVPMQNSEIAAKRAEWYMFSAMSFQSEPPVDEHAQQHRVEHRHHRGLGRREQSADDAADDDAGRENRQQRLADDARHFLLVARG